MYLLSLAIVYAILERFMTFLLFLFSFPQESNKNNKCSVFIFTLYSILTQGICPLFTQIQGRVCCSQDHVKRLILNIVQPQLVCKDFIAVKSL